jgi:hypothetical protein
LLTNIISDPVPPEERGGEQRVGTSSPDHTVPAYFDSELVFFGYSDQLDERVYDGTKVGGLSGLAYGARQNLYYAVVDREAEDAPARFYTLRLPYGDGRLDDPEILGVKFLRDPTGQPYTGGDFDGEGIAFTSRDGLFVASEIEPSIRRFSPEGRFLAQLPVPRKYRVVPQGQTRSNGSFESLSTSPNGRSMFTAPQYPLLVDGRTPEGRHRIRLLRYERRGGGGYRPSEEFFYLTEPGNSLTDITALSERELLVLEGELIFRVPLDEAEDVSKEKDLATSEVAPVYKELLVDLDDCPAPRGANVGRAFPEGLELGESLPGGRQALVAISDDNFNSDLKTRVIALAVLLRSSTPLSGAATCE